MFYLFFIAFTLSSGLFFYTAATYNKVPDIQTGFAMVFAFFFSGMWTSVAIVKLLGL